MGPHRLSARIAGLAAAFTTAVLTAATPAHAYKVNDGLDINLKVFNQWVLTADEDTNAGFEITRAYFEVRRSLESGDLVRVTLDQDRTDGGSNTPKNRVHLKYAYWQHALGADTTVKVGLQQAPFVDYDNDKFWGFRYVAKAYLDHYNVQTSADNGVAFEGKAGGHFLYHVGVFNGEGRHDRDGSGYAVTGHVEANAAGVHVGGYVSEEAEHAAANGPDVSNRLVYAFFENDAVRVGGEYLLKADDGGAAFTDAKGFNVQGKARLPVAGMSLFGRYDVLDKLDNGQESRMTIIGLEIPVTKEMRIAPNWRTIEEPGTANDDTQVAIHAEFRI